MVRENCGSVIVVIIQLCAMSCASHVTVSFIFGVCKYKVMILEFHAFQIHYSFIYLFPLGL
jgi:hypothetical protein